MNKGTLATIGRNLLAIALCPGLINLAVIAGRPIHVGVITNVLEVVATCLSVWCAFRLAAVVGVAFNGTIAVLIGVEFLYHMIFGYRNVQGGPVHMAVGTAALVGLLLGIFAAPRIAAFGGRNRGTKERVIPEQAIESQPAQRSSLGPAALRPS